MFFLCFDWIWERMGELGFGYDVQILYITLAAIPLFPLGLGGYSLNAQNIIAPFPQPASSSAFFFPQHHSAQRTAQSAQLTAHSSQLE
jgi:hypothetical protein